MIAMERWIFQATTPALIKPRHAPYNQDSLLPLMAGNATRVMEAFEEPILRG
jgi:hypothetical protein